ncbi:MAG TPA: hypothetical protein DC057_15475 [Spirochaetia bacterium]|nr:hypothetical protein [Spirochaetia bacterium]
MANETNDSKIMELKKQIEEKKAKLIKSQKFSPITNSSIELDGVRTNIQVLNKEQLTYLLVKLNSYAISAKELEIDFVISGYHIVDWIADIKSKLDFVSRKEEENKLKVMESKLHQLLSNEKKVELEIDEIMKNL